MAKELKLLGTTWACYFRASLCVTSSLPRVSHTHIDHPQQAQAGNHHAQLKKLPHWYFSCCHFSLHTTTESHHANTHPDREREREGGWMAEKLSDANHWSEHTHTQSLRERVGRVCRQRKSPSPSHMCGTERCVVKLQVYQTTAARRSETEAALQAEPIFACRKYICNTIFSNIGYYYKRCKILWTCLMKVLSLQ